MEIKTFVIHLERETARRAEICRSFKQVQITYKFLPAIWSADLVITKLSAGINNRKLRYLERKQKKRRTAIFISLKDAGISLP